MANTKKKEYSFKTKTKKMLDIMIHSIYTHKEIFLRELISNSADALNKIRFKSLTNKKLLDDDTDLEINIEFDKDKRTLSVEDNGIGMSRQEIIDNIGTVAQSGSQNFLEKLKEEKDAMELIGQFGVGFYSSFMVSSKVEIISKKPDNEAVKWVSKGDGKFTIDTSKRKKHGTKIILHLREGDEFDEFLDQYKIQNLVKKYSNYIPYPIKMDFKKQIPDESSDKENTTKEVVEKKILNSMKPLWKKNKNNIEEKDYKEFYKNFFGDWNEPFDYIHTKAEGLVSYHALMYIPSETPPNYYHKDFKPGLNLYSKQIFIMKHCEELLPEYLHFVKGIVDSPDFSLNISRETLQKDKKINRIGKSLEKKIIKLLEKKLENNRENFENWWENFGTTIKNGIYQNPSKKDMLQDLLLFHSTNSKEGRTTLSEYVDRMTDKQKYIYYLVTSERKNAENLPQLEKINEKGYEVLLFTDPVDEFLTTFLNKYNDYELKSLNKEEIDLEKEDNKSIEKKEKENKTLLETIKNNLKDKVNEVKLSKRLNKSAACLVSENSGMSIHTEELLKKTQNLPFESNRILEINPNHKLFSILKNEYDNNKNSKIIKEYSDLLYNQALVMEGLPVENPSEFAKKISDLMVKAEDREEN